MKTEQENRAALLAYRPKVENVHLVVTPKTWAVYLSPRATVLDLAILMNGMGPCCETKRADITLGILVVPTSPNIPPPSLERVRAILQAGFQEGAPMLSVRQAG